MMWNSTLRYDRKLVGFFWCFFFCLVGFLFFCFGLFFLSIVSLIDFFIPVLEEALKEFFFEI